jgi:2-oxoglutarate dehydrogenase E2 component (dihydrolipoamide succinyltransferase)
MIEVTVPSVGESIQEVQISQWLKQEGEWVAEGEDLVELETEKASVPLPAPTSGILVKLLKAKEEFAAVGDVIAHLEPAERPAGGASAPGAASVSTASASTASASTASASTSEAAAAGGGATSVMPSAQVLLDQHGLAASQVPATGPGGRLLKEDVLSHVRSQPAAPPSPAQAPAPAADVRKVSGTLEMSLPGGGEAGLIGTNRREEVKPLSMIRRTIAARLVQAQQTAALLTTFNEVNMQPVMELRNKYKDAFQQRHGVKLGFMSFFAKAAVEALRRIPAVNAEIRGNNVVYRHYCDIGIAIGSGKGLVVPVVRNVELLSFADIERAISEFARRAGENRLMPEDLEGGTFTISNGGVYGSMLSTPIVNPPQSGILGLHAIQERPMAEQGQVVVRPMMYLALTYDHRIIDGREAVTFLKTIKEVIEDPARLFLEV